MEQPPQSMRAWVDDQTDLLGFFLNPIRFTHSFVATGKATLFQIFLTPDGVFGYRLGKQPIRSEFHRLIFLLPFVTFVVLIPYFKLRLLFLPISFLVSWLFQWAIFRFIFSDCDAEVAGVHSLLANPAEFLKAKPENFILPREGLTLHFKMVKFLLFGSGSNFLSWEILAKNGEIKKIFRFPTGQMDCRGFLEKSDLPFIAFVEKAFDWEKVPKPAEIPPHFWCYGRRAHFSIFKQSYETPDFIRFKLFVSNRGLRGAGLETHGSSIAGHNLLSCVVIVGGLYYSFGSDKILFLCFLIALIGVTPFINLGFWLILNRLVTELRTTLSPFQEAFFRDDLKFKEVRRGNISLNREDIQSPLVYQKGLFFFNVSFYRARLEVTPTGDKTEHLYFETEDSLESALDLLRQQGYEVKNGPWGILRTLNNVFSLFLYYFTHAISWGCFLGSMLFLPFVIVLLFSPASTPDLLKNMPPDSHSISKVNYSGKNYMAREWRIFSDAPPRTKTITPEKGTSQSNFVDKDFHKNRFTFLKFRREKPPLVRGGGELTKIGRLMFFHLPFFLFLPQSEGLGCSLEKNNGFWDLVGKRRNPPMNGEGNYETARISYRMGWLFMDQKYSDPMPWFVPTPASASAGIASVSREVAETLLPVLSTPHCWEMGLLNREGGLEYEFKNLDLVLKEGSVASFPTILGKDFSDIFHSINSVRMWCDSPRDLSLQFHATVTIHPDPTVETTVASRIADGFTKIDAKAPGLFRLGELKIGSGTLEFDFFRNHQYYR